MPASTLQRDFAQKKEDEILFFSLSILHLFSKHTHDDFYQIVLISSFVALKWNEQKPPEYECDSFKPNLYFQRNFQEE